MRKWGTRGYNSESTGAMFPQINLACETPGPSCHAADVFPSVPLTWLPVKEDLFVLSWELHIVLISEIKGATAIEDTEEETGREETLNYKKLTIGVHMS